MSFVKRNQSLKYYEKEVSEDYFIIEKNIIFAGTHIILDLWNCSFSNKIAPLKKIIKEAANLSKAKILHMHMHRFGKEQGISGETKERQERSSERATHGEGRDPTCTRLAETAAEHKDRDESEQRKRGD